MDRTLAIACQCCHCQQNIHVTLKCSYEFLHAPAEDDVAAVNIPCPNCQQVNQLLFDLCGVVRAVRPPTLARALPEPSVN